jgi:proliferating cell nuclear antigen
MKDFVKFSVEGQMGSGSVTLRQNSTVDDDEGDVVIAIDQPISLDFSVKYLKNFASASSLAPRVALHLSNEIPMLVDFKLENLGYLRYYLASKISDDDEEMMEDEQPIAAKVEEDY